MIEQQNRISAGEGLLSLAGRLQWALLVDGRPSRRPSFQAFVVVDSIGRLAGRLAGRLH